MSTILKTSWRIYKQRFGSILAIVLIIWIPLELLSSYMDAFVFGPDDFRRSFRFAQFLDNFIGIIATAGVISVAHNGLSGGGAGFKDALGIGFASWARMWWTRFLSCLAILAGALFLIVPGIYLLVRLSLVEQIAVQERMSGVEAMRRSFALTEGRFWKIFLLGLVLIGLGSVVFGVFMLPTALIPVFDYWLIDATTSLIFDLLSAFGTVAFVTVYLQCQSQQTAATLTPTAHHET